MKQLTLNKTVIFAVALVLAFVGTRSQTYGATTVSYTFSPNTTISSSQVNKNFSDLATAIDKNASGVDFSNSTGFTGVSDNNVHNISLVTVTCPDAGYVLLIASGDAVFFGDNTVIELSINLSSTAMDTYFIRLGRQDGSGTLRYTLPFSYTIVKPVAAAGTYTFYMNVQRESTFSANVVNIDPVTFSGIYIRNKY